MVVAVLLLPGPHSLAQTPRAFLVVSVLCSCWGLAGLRACRVVRHVPRQQRPVWGAAAGREGRKRAGGCGSGRESASELAAPGTVPRSERRRTVRILTTPVVPPVCYGQPPLRVSVVVFFFQCRSRLGSDAGPGDRLRRCQLSRVVVVLASLVRSCVQYVVVAQE